MTKTFHSKALLFFVLAITLRSWRGRGEGDCYPSSCGDIRNISSPFRLPDDPEHCGYPEYNLSCDRDQTVLYLYSQKFLVKVIDYENQVIQVVDPILHSNDCSSFRDDALFNLYYDSSDMLRSAYVPYMLPSAYVPYMLPSAYYKDYGDVIPATIVFVNCSVPVTDDLSHCKANTSFFSGSSCNSLSIIWGYTEIGNLHHSCPIVGNIYLPIYGKRVPMNFSIYGKRVPMNFTCARIHDVLDVLKMVNLSWKAPLSCKNCFEKNYRCSLFDQVLGIPTPNSSRLHEDHCYKHTEFCYSVFQSFYCFFSYVTCNETAYPNGGYPRIHGKH